MKKTNAVNKEIAEIRKAIRKQANEHREDMQALQNLYGLQPVSKIYSR